MLKKIRNLIVLFTLLYTLSSIIMSISLNFSDIMFFMADNNKDINLHGHVSVTTEAGKAIELELQTI